MRRNGLDLNLLVALDALLTERNVSRAAERVFVSQPGMSNALTKLRDFSKMNCLAHKMYFTVRGDAMRHALQ
jgi:LysR family transcriptional regulator, nod-box dependent transcriptional activator